jgi:hypothetical protein
MILPIRSRLKASSRSLIAARGLPLEAPVAEIVSGLLLSVLNYRINRRRISKLFVVNIDQVFAVFKLARCIPFLNHLTRCAELS